MKITKETITVNIDKEFFEIAKKVMEREYITWSEWRKALNPKMLTDEEIIVHIIIHGIRSMERIVEDFEDYDSEVKGMNKEE